MVFGSLIVGNWKMNGTPELALAYVERLLQAIPKLSNRLVLCPPYPLISLFTEKMSEMGSAVLVGAQDCHYADAGSYTGNVSAPLLRSMGCDYVIVGHSERRINHAETDQVVAAKVEAVHRAGMRAILCIGETAAERDSGITFKTIERQLARSLPVSATEDNMVIAYEPIWAIGTGLTPIAEDIVTIHKLINRLNEERQQRIEILYGGSVKPDNAAEILDLPGVNGVLVGGACLNPEDFLAIAES